MARKTSELLSWCSVMWEVAKAIVHAVLDLGGSDEDVRRILTDATLPKRIAEVIMGVGAKAAEVRSWPIWKTIILGTHKSLDALRAALKAGGNEASPFAQDILAKITLASEVTSVDLVQVTVRDLGFTKATAWSKILAKAQELGLMLCPAEVGPQLRLQYGDQPNGEYLWVGMEPISDSDRYFHVFGVDCDADRWLCTSYADPDDVWDPSYRLVFVRPRK